MAMLLQRSVPTCLSSGVPNGQREFIPCLLQRSRLAATTGHVVLAGEFNFVEDPSLDRGTPRATSQAAGGTYGHSCIYTCLLRICLMHLLYRMHTCLCLWMVPMSRPPLQLPLTLYP